MTEAAAETPWEDLRRMALEHYEKVSSTSHEWSSSVPRAINFYFDNAPDSRNTHASAAPVAPSVREQAQKLVEQWYYEVSTPRFENDSELEDLIDRIAAISAAPVDAEGMVERLAALCHEQWSGWMRYLFDRCDYSGKEVTIPLVWFHRWQRQMKTDYADLPKNEKESDRVEAQRIIATLEAIPVEKEKQDG